MGSRAFDYSEHKYYVQARGARPDHLQIRDRVRWDTSSKHGAEENR